MEIVTLTTQNDYSTQHSNWKFALFQNQGLYFVSIFSSRLTLQLYKLDFTRLSLDQNFAIKHILFLCTLSYTWRVIDLIGVGFYLIDSCILYGEYGSLQGCIVRRHKNKSHLVRSEEGVASLPLPWSAGASKPA